MSYEFLTGREAKNLKEIKLENNRKTLIHQDMEKPFFELKKELLKENIQLSIVSSYRSYETQLNIWNAKALGQRTLLDKDENILKFNELSSVEILQSLLTWSAIPGSSRHHWGSEIDIFDAHIKERSFVKLTQHECQEDFYKLYQVLDEHLARYDFFRPYQTYQGGVACEPWHLSYAPLSHEFSKAYDLNLFQRNLKESNNMQLRNLILENSEFYFRQFVLNIQS